MSEEFTQAPLSEAEYNEQLENILQSEQTKTKKPKSKRKKILIGTSIAFACLIVIVIFILAAMGGNQNNQVYNAQALTTKDIKQTLSLTAPLEGTDSVEIVSKLHSEINSISVKEGDKVKTGTVLATLDSGNFLGLLNQANTSYAKAQGDYQTAENNFKRQKALFEQGAVSLSDLETAQSALNSAAVGLESAQYELDNAKTNYQQTQITSPINGTVTRVNAKLGRFADTTEDNTPLFIVENLDSLSMEVKVSEYSIGKIKVGQKAKITCDILNGDFVNGEVSAISPTGEEKGGGSTERVIPITIQILEENGRLIAGITAKAEVLLAEQKDALVIPLSAIIQNPDGTTSIASVSENGTVSLIAVKCGIENDFEVAISAEGDSLSAGQSIITNPDSTLSDGAVVAVQFADTAPTENNDRQADNTNNEAVQPAQ